jgi:hypothetical protein
VSVALLIKKEFVRISPIAIWRGVMFSNMSKYLYNLKKEV